MPAMSRVRLVHSNAALTAMHRMATDMATEQTAANGPNNWSGRPMRQRSADKGTGACSNDRPHSSVAAAAIVPAIVPAIDMGRAVAAIVVMASLRRRRNGDRNERCAGGHRQNPLLQHR